MFEDNGPWEVSNVVITVVEEFVIMSMILNHTVDTSFSKMPTCQLAIGIIQT